MTWWRVSLIGIAFLLWPLRARAEMPPQNREEAPIALTGIVESIAANWESNKTSYHIYVRVSQTDRGQGLRPGELFGVTCFKRPPSAARMPTAMGHSSIPEIGDRIHLFAWPSSRGVGHKGNYPHWYDLIEPSHLPWMARQFGYRNVRIMTVVVCVGVVGLIGWGWRIWLKRRAVRPSRREAIQAR